MIYPCIYFKLSPQTQACAFPQHKSIHTATAAAAAARADDPRASVGPPAPSPIPFHPRPRAPSQLHYRASALRASGPGNNFPKNRNRKKERRPQRAPSRRGETSPGRGLCPRCSPVSNQVTTPQTPRPPRRRPQTAPPAPRRTRTSRAGLAVGAGGRGGALRTRASAANPHSPSERVGRSQLCRRRPPAARPAGPAHTRARTTRSRRPRPPPPAPRSPSPGAGRGRGAPTPLCTVRAGQVSSQLRGTSTPGEMQRRRLRGGGAGRREGQKSGEKCEKKQQPLHPRPEK